MEFVRYVITRAQRMHRVTVRCADDCTAEEVITTRNLSFPKCSMDVSIVIEPPSPTAEKDLVSSGTIHRVLDLFFEYPYNNALHHHVESIIFSCLESKNITIVDHVFQECGLVPRILQTNRSPTVFGELNQPTIAAAGKCGPRLGNLGHITRISNKLVQLGKPDSRIKVHLQTGKLTLQSDIYAFGVVLLELLTGRRAVDLSQGSSEQNIVLQVVVLLLFILFLQFGGGTMLTCISIC